MKIVIMDITERVLELEEEGFEIEDICSKLSLPLATVEEIIDLAVLTPVNDLIQVLPPFDESSFEGITKEEVQAKALGCLAYVLTETAKNVNNDALLLRLHKVNIILEKVVVTAERIKTQRSSHETRFSKFYKD